MDEIRQKWLDGLKIGDEVCVQTSGTLGTRYEVTKIDKITPTHKMRVGSLLYDKCGETHRGWTYYTIIPATEEIKQRIKDRNMRYRVKHTDFDALEQDKINKIYGILYEV